MVEHLRCRYSEIERYGEGMAILQKISGVVDRYVTVLSNILKVNVEVIDDTYKVISSTEQANLGKRNEAYVYKTVLATGEKKIITNPGNDKICALCGKRDRCRDTFELHTPIQLNNVPIGVICFSCDTEEQRAHFFQQFDTLMEFIDQISDLIALKAAESQEQEQALRYIDVLSNVIDQVEQGIIVTSKNGKILRSNQVAKRLLHLNLDELPTAYIQESVNENEYCLTLGDKQYYLIGELHKLGAFDVEFNYVFIFENKADFNRKAANVTSRSENVGLKNILGESQQIRNLKADVQKIAGSSSTVLITGPSGTGKELFARAIHKESNRSHQPFVAINCAAIPDTLLESELFGYVKGAFTGADPKGKVGKIELANHGILFLDEVGDMPLYLQAKVLRALEQHEIVRLGSNIPTKVDVRFLAATNKDLATMIEQKKFREDLFYRLNVIPLTIPALHERRDDIPVLTNFFIEKYSGLLQKRICGIRPETQSRLIAYEWPGNVRELENTVEYMINMAEDNSVLSNDTLPPGLLKENKPLPDSLQSLEDMERYMIQRALNQYGTGYADKQKVAQSLGIGVATLYRKIKKYHLEDDLSK